MPYEVFLGRTPEKVYSKLTAKLRKAVDRCLAYLEANATHGPNVVKLKGQPRCYRYHGRMANRFFICDFGRSPDEPIGSIHWNKITSLRPYF